MVRAGLKAIYLSGWQVAADANTAGQMYPDQSLYPANCRAGTGQAHQPHAAARRPDRTFRRQGPFGRHWFAPIVADAEAGFGGPLNAFEIMKAFIEAGAAGVHFEDQLASEKKCGHLGGKVLIPTAAHIRNLTPRASPPTSWARADADRRPHRRRSRQAAHLRHRRARPALRRPDAGRTPEGFYQVKNGIEPCIARAIAYAPYCDLIWMETGKPDLDRPASSPKPCTRQHPGKMLAYNCSPSFNWKKNLDDATIAKFQRELGAMGYKFQFITLAGFHQLNYGMFELARGYKDRQMAAYSELQEAEFAAESTATPRPSTSAKSAPAISTPGASRDGFTASRAA
jgi:isocitrate lyase